MAKIRVRTGRGTGTIEVDNDPANWTGDEFRRIQAARKRQGSATTVHTGRGTGTRKLADTPDPKPKPSSKGMTRVTGRGTGSRKSRGK